MHVINVSVVDNKIAPFAMGLSYTRVKGSDFKTGNRVDLAFSVPLGQSFFIGTDIKYIDFDQLGIEDRTETVTLDVGAMLRSSFGLNLAVVGYNLTNPKDYIDHPVSMAVGLSWTLFQSLNLAADWFINFQNPSDLQDLSKKKEIGHCAFVGAEYTFMEMISLRAGYIFDRTELDQNEHYWTVGVGYVSLSGKFNFGYQGNIHHTWGGIFGVSIELFI
jgi:opacity protein-like surface antigen